MVYVFSVRGGGRGGREGNCRSFHADVDKRTGFVSVLIFFYLFFFLSTKNDICSKSKQTNKQTTTKTPQYFSTARDE